MKTRGFFAILLGGALAGCFRHEPLLGPGDADWGVEVTWHGHSCFSVVDSTGRRLLVDPFDETVGYPLPGGQSDVTLVTHDHFDHNHVRRAFRQEVVNSSGTHTVAGLEITAVIGEHDDLGGRRHGPTLFFIWEMGGLRLAHLGDVGQKELTLEQKAALGAPDVLFVPVGGRTTVDALGAYRFAKELGARWVVPMHYGAPGVRFFEFDPLDLFLSLSLFENIRQVDTTFRLRGVERPSALTVVVPAEPKV